MIDSSQGHVPEKMGKNLSISAEFEKKKPKLRPLIEMNISERSEGVIKKFTDYDICSGAKDPLLLLLDIIQTHQLASIKDPLVDEDAAV